MSDPTPRTAITLNVRNADLKDVIDALNDNYGQFDPANPPAPWVTNRAQFAKWALGQMLTRVVRDYRSRVATDSMDIT
jgi:hypothetical protein